MRADLTEGPTGVVPLAVLAVETGQAEGGDTRRQAALVRLVAGLPTAERTL